MPSGLPTPGTRTQSARPPRPGSSPLQPGHTQVAVVTAPESLGERVVLNFQLCDLSGEDTQQGCWGRGPGWPRAPVPHPRHSRNAQQGPPRSLAGAPLASPLTSRHWLLPTLLAADPLGLPSALPTPRLQSPTISWGPVTASCPGHRSPAQLPHQVRSDRSKCRPDSVTLCLTPTTAYGPPAVTPRPPHRAPCACREKHPERVARQRQWPRAGGRASSGGGQDTPGLLSTAWEGPAGGSVPLLPHSWGCTGSPPHLLPPISLQAQNVTLESHQGERYWRPRVLALKPMGKAPGPSFHCYRLHPAPDRGHNHTGPEVEGLVPLPAHYARSHCSEGQAGSEVPELPPELPL